MSRKYLISQYLESIPLFMAIDEYLNTRAQDPINTYRALKVDLMHYANFLALSTRRPIGTLVFCDATKSSIEAWRDDCLKTSSPRTVSRRLAHVKVFFKFLTEKHFALNPALEVKTPQLDKLTFKALNEKQYDQLLKNIEYLPVRNWFLILLLLNTGIRREEARTITLGNLSEGWTWLENVKGKGNKKRNIPINKEFRRCILRYMDWRKKYPMEPDYPLLVSNNSAKKSKPNSWRLNGKTIYRIVNEALLEVTTKELAHPHTLRHTFARRSLASIGAKISNAPKALTMVKEMLGHSSIDTTMIYLNNDKNEIFELMEDFG